MSRAREKERELADKGARLLNSMCVCSIGRSEPVFSPDIHSTRPYLTLLHAGTVANQRGRPFRLTVSLSFSEGERMWTLRCRRTVNGNPAEREKENRDTEPECAVSVLSFAEPLWIACRPLARQQPTIFSVYYIITTAKGESTTTCRTPKGR